MCTMKWTHLCLCGPALMINPPPPPVLKTTAVRLFTCKSHFPEYMMLEYMTEGQENDVKSKTGNEFETNFTIDDLTTAAARGDLHLVTTLLETGINVNHKNKFGRTSLQVTKLGCPLVAEILLEHGADPNLRESCCCTFTDKTYPFDGGLTVMHDASRDGFQDILTCLLKYGADVNLRDCKGNTPAHIAAKQGHYNIVRYLSQAVDLSRSYDNEGNTPLDLEHVGSAAPRSYRKWAMRQQRRPRTLQNISCTSIRDCLGTKNLRCYVELPLPQKLKDFISLQNRSKPLKYST